MPATDDDNRPKKRSLHEIGQDLTLLSVGELNGRIALLKDEIALLEADIKGKQALEGSGRSVLQEVTGNARHDAPQPLSRRLTITISQPLVNHNGPFCRGPSIVKA